MEPLLTVRDASIAFDGRPLVQHLNFEVAPGEVLALIGPNGSGKTSILKAILGLIPYQGSIVRGAATRLAYVPQKIDADRHLPLHLEDLLAAKCDALSIPKMEIKEVLATVGISEKIRTTPIGHLSGGQFQKALIAFALLGKPNLVLFDEPTASLDQLSEEHIYDLIHELQEKHGISVILISHDLSVVYHYANKVLCVNREMLCFGAPEEVLTPENLQKLYMAPHKFFHHTEAPHQPHQ